MSADLERSYRRALAWYPRSWRDKNADVVVGTLLDVADAEHRTRPRRGEVVGLAASGLSTRLGLVLEPRARDAISTIALATGVGYLVVYLALQLWSTTATSQAATGMTRPIVNSGLIVVAVWTAALIVGLTRPQRGLKPVMLVAILASIALCLVNRIPPDIGQWYGLTTTSLVFLGLLGLLTLLGTPRRGVRLALYLVVAIACIAGAHLTTRYAVHAELDESRFWIYVLRILLPVLGAAALAAVVNGIVGRTAMAQILAISTLPWVGAYLIVCLAADQWTTVAEVGFITVLVSFGVALSVIFQRGRLGKRENLTKL